MSAYLGGTPLHCAPDVLLLSSQLPVVISVAWAGVGGMAGSSLVINLEKKSRIVLSVKRTTKERKETYLLCFETLSNMGVHCRTRRTRVMWHGCSHVCHCLVWLKGFGSGRCGYGGEREG